MGLPSILKWLPDPAEGRTDMEREILFPKAAKDIYERVKVFAALSDEEMTAYHLV